MSYQLTFSLYTTAGLADLRAQLFDTAGTNSGAAVSTGFVEVGTNGMYLWTGTIPDSFIGGVKFYSLATSSDILGICAINPLEAENSDVKTSTRATPAQVATELATYDAPTKAELDSGLALLATQTSVNTIDDLLDTEIAAIQSALTSLATKVAAIRAGVVGRSVADDANDPTEIEYYDEDDTTVLFTHTLTDTERTVA